MNAANDPVACPHDVWECESAAVADSMCPLCLAAALDAQRLCADAAEADARAQREAAVRYMDERDAAEAEARALREALKDMLSLIADDDSGDRRGELIRDTSRDNAPDYALRMMRLVKVLATAQRLAARLEGAG